MSNYEGEQFYDENRDGVAEIDPEYRQYLMDLRQVAFTAEGQRVLIWILGALGTCEPAWHPKNANMARAIVLKDFGQDILDDLAIAAGEAHDAIQRSIRIARRAGLTNKIFETKTEED
jgi:hypothetical protein